MKKTPKIKIERANVARLPRLEFDRFWTHQTSTLGLSVVDQFLIVSVERWREHQDGNVVYNLVSTLRTFAGDFKVLLDLSRASQLTNDVALLLELGRDFIKPVISPMTGCRTLCTLNDGYIVSISRPLTSLDWVNLPCDVFEATPPEECVQRFTYAGKTFGNLDHCKVHLKPFSCPARSLLPTTAAERSSYFARRSLFEQVIRVVASNSLLTQFCLQTLDGQIAVAPYHGNALWQLKTERPEIVVAQPNSLARMTGAFLSDDIKLFQQILSDPDLREQHLQDFFERHEQFLKALGYAEIRPQLVLSRESGGPLIPDFFVRPVGSDFWDILDVKLPHVKLFAGKVNRLRFTSHVVSVIAQLREYAAAFEDDRVRQRVLNRYGIKCYKPKLVALIGRSDPSITSEESQRVLNDEKNVRLITFDELTAVASNRLLI